MASCSTVEETAGSMGWRPIFDLTLQILMAQNTLIVYSNSFFSSSDSFPFSRFCKLSGVCNKYGYKTVESGRVFAKLV